MFTSMIAVSDGELEGEEVQRESSEYSEHNRESILRE